MNCLHNVIYGCTVVTHGASQRCRKSRASQSCTQFTAAIRLFAGCCGQDGSRLLCFPPSSISVSPTSRATEAGRSSDRCQDRFHSEAFRRISRKATCIRQQERHIAQRPGDSGVGGFSPKEEEAWLNDHQVGATRFSWNIDLTVCYRRSWNRFMSYWSRISDGRSKRQRFRRT